MIPLRAVNQEDYDETVCNGCGDCCSSFTLNEESDPLSLIIQTANDRVGTYDAMWFGQLTPAWREDLGAYVYSCGYFELSDDLLTGRCSIHDARPGVCRNYPNNRDGKSGALPKRCAWAEVEVVDPAEQVPDILGVGLAEMVP